MILRVVANRDLKIGVFEPPITVQYLQDAIRGYIKSTLKPENRVAQFPTDYSLWELGSFDTETGKFESLEVAHMLMSGQEACIEAQKLLMGSNKEAPVASSIH